MLQCFYELTAVFLLRTLTGEVFDYLVSHGRMKEVEARAKFRQVKNMAPPDAYLVPVLIFNCRYLSSVHLLAFTDCFRCPLLPHKEHCPQRFEGENAQKLHCTENYNLGLVLICVCEKAPLTS